MQFKFAFGQMSFNTAFHTCSCWVGLGLIHIKHSSLLIEKISLVRTGKTQSRKKGNVLFNDTFNTFMVIWRKPAAATWATLSDQEGRKCFYLMTHSTHFIYGYMASDIWLRTILIVRKETRCRHIGYSFRSAARVLLYAPSHRQDNMAFVTPVMEHWLE